MKHYLESAEAVFQEVNSNENGLSSAEAAARLEKYGVSEIHRRTFLKNILGDK